MSVVHCKREQYDVYVGRGRCPRTGEFGRWGNPYRVSALLSREDAIAEYRTWLWDELQSEANRGDDRLLRALASLDGKTLGCWCSPKPCHGDVLVRAAAWAARQVDGFETQQADQRHDERYYAYHSSS